MSLTELNDYSVHSTSFIKRTATVYLLCQLKHLNVWDCPFNQGKVIQIDNFD